MLMKLDTASLTRERIEHLGTVNIVSVCNRGYLSLDKLEEVRQASTREIVVYLAQGEMVLEHVCVTSSPLE
jgi:hypothetical protein